MHHALKCSTFFLPDILNELGVFYMRSQSFKGQPRTSQLLKDPVLLFCLVKVDRHFPFSVPTYAYLINIALWEF